MHGGTRSAPRSVALVSRRARRAAQGLPRRDRARGRRCRESRGRGLRARAAAPMCRLDRRRPPRRRRRPRSSPRRGSRAAPLRVPAGYRARRRASRRSHALELARKPLRRLAAAFHPRADELVLLVVVVRPHDVDRAAVLVVELCDVAVAPEPPHQLYRGGIDLEASERRAETAPVDLVALAHRARLLLDLVRAHPTISS